MSRTSDVCLFTVATERFVPGTLVMIDTFLKHHPGFDGDVVVVQDGLSAASREMLQAAFGRLRFEAVSPEMKSREEAVRHLFHLSPDRTAPLYCLEAFRLTGYRKVLCCDSDLLFQGCIAELFDSTEVLLCCGDRPFLFDRPRDAATGLPVRPVADGERPAGGRPVLERTFNTGFLLIDARLLGEATYSDLLDMVSPEGWDDVRCTGRLLDQTILNRYFAGRQTLVSWTYNYVLPVAAAIRAREGLDPGRAKVLHYVGPAKPWMSDGLLHCWVPGGFKHRPIPEFELWYDAWLDCLTRAWLRNARKGLAGAEHFRGGGFSATAAEPEPVPRPSPGRDAP